MSFGLLNAAMLAGLGVVALPVIAHLLSKRRFDVVQWGAMRFLELGQRTRRRIQLQDLLLLLMRMAAVGLVALAICRPWGQGGFIGRLAGSVSRDVVFVIDGSYSMGWEGHAVTPHAAAAQWVHEAVEELSPGDTAVVVDAREFPRMIESPTTDLDHVRDVVDELPEPSGSSDLPAAILEGIQTLAGTMNVSREVIVLTDQQRLPWRIEDEFLWTRLSELQKQNAVRPTISVVNVAETEGDRPNFSIDSLQLSRELTVPDFPLRIRGVVRQSGGQTGTVKVQFKVNGQALPEQVREVQLLANGESIVELEHRFDAVGSYLVSLAVDHDNLPADNESTAVVRVADGIPVLIVDGAPHLDQTRAESFFVASALGASGTEAPWVRATVIEPEQLTEAAIGASRVIFLCNVPRLSDAQAKLLNAFVTDGGGLVIAPGDRTIAPAWNDLQAAENLPFLPARLDAVRDEKELPEEQATVSHPSLNRQWLERFRKESGVDFCATRFSKWWRLETAPKAGAAAQESEAISPPDVVIRLSTNDPLLVMQRRGDGQIAQLAAPLDADWSTLPARSDYVPFLHEIVFLLTSSASPRNVEIGAPLLLPLEEGQSADELLVEGPALKEPVAAEEFFAGRMRLARFGEARLPGIYRFRTRDQPPGDGEPFLVNSDRAESDLTPLEEAEWAKISADDQLIAIAEMSERTRQINDTKSRAELWWWLLWGVLALLVAEVALTRQMVRGGHTTFDADPDVEAQPPGETGIELGQQGGSVALAEPAAPQGAAAD